MKNLKNIVLAALVAACLALCATALAGCGGSGSDSASASGSSDGASSQNPDEEAVIQAISTQLDVMKDPNGELATVLNSDENLSGLFQTVGISSEDFLTAYLEGFNYKIDNVKVDGDTATADITLTCRSYADLSTALESAMNDPNSEVSKATEEASANASETGTVDMSGMGQPILNLVKSVPASEQTPVSVTLSKDTEGNWTVDDLSGALQQIFQGSN